MNVVLNKYATSHSELFNLTHERAGQILSRLAGITAHAIVTFEENYYVTVVDRDGDHMHGVNMYKVLNEMLELAETEDEKNYILFCANTALEQIDKAVFQK